MDCSHKYIIFDADRTLLKNQICAFALWSLAANTFLRLPLGWYTSIIQLPSGAFPVPRPLEMLFIQAPKLHWLAVQADLALQKVFRFLDRLVSPRPRLYPGVAQILEALQKEGKLLFASTGGFSSSLFQALEETGISHYFTCIAGIEQGGKSRHLPLFADYIKLPLKELAKSAVIISDGPVDHIIARRLCVPCTIGICTTFPAAILQKAGAAYTTKEVGFVLEIIEL